jgi:hypothetical protein
LEKRSSKFAKLFGEKSLCVARRLLIEAQQGEEDPEIQTVISKRIKAIDAEQPCPEEKRHETITS